MAIHLYAVSILTAFVVEGDLSHYFWKKRMSRLIVQGDAYEEHVLANAGIERAAAAAIALPTARDNLVTTLSIRTMNPKIRIVVKEIEPGMASRFRRAGADAIVNPAAIGGLRLVSEMVRPCVVSFLDLMLRDPVHAYRLEELSINSLSPWVNHSLKELPLHSEYKLLVAAARKADETDFTYNPDGTWTVELGQTLIVLGKADDVSRARQVAQVALA